MATRKTLTSQNTDGHTFKEHYQNSTLLAQQEYLTMFPETDQVLTLVMFLISIIHSREYIGAGAKSQIKGYTSDNTVTEFMCGGKGV